MRKSGRDCESVLHLMFSEFELELICGALDLVANQAAEKNVRSRCAELVNKIHGLALKREAAVLRTEMISRQWKTRAEIRDAQF